MEPAAQTSTYEYVSKRPSQFKAPDFHNLDENLKKVWCLFFTNWVWQATNSLMGVKGFTPSARWVAKRLQVPVEYAVDALEGLEVLGLLRRSQNGKVIPTENMLVYEFDNSGLPKNDLLRHHLELSSQLNSRILDHENMRIDNMYVASTRPLVKECVQKIRQALLDLAEESKKSLGDDVFAFTFNGATLSTGSTDSLTEEPSLDQLLRAKFG